MKLNQLKAGALLSYVQAGCSVVITLAYTPLMLRLLGQSEYGVYTLASSLTAYLGLLHFGLSGSYIRFYTRYRAAGDQRGVNQLNALFLTVYTTWCPAFPPGGWPPMACWLCCAGCGSPETRSSFSEASIPGRSWR